MGSADDLRRTAELFHQRVRWRDFGGAAELLVPERRTAFIKAFESDNSDGDLQITEYELLELTLEEEEEQRVGQVLSRVSWLRLPSLSVHTERVHSKFVCAGTTWLLARQDRGPFREVLDLPYPEKKPPTVPGPAEAVGVGGSPMEPHTEGLR